MNKTSNQVVSLPDNLHTLRYLAENYYWVWNREIRYIFENRIDPAAWNGVGNNPIALLNQLSESRLKELANTSDFVTSVSHAYDLQRAYLHEKENTWFQKAYGFLEKNNQLVAYFSAEFGIASCFKIYSGGLGILSGDHLKSASDLGIPLVGIGLFYRRGYFSQNLTHDGWQTESYPENDTNNLAIEPVLAADSKEPLVISVQIKDRQVRVKAWKVSVGRVTLYLLDTYLPGLNSKEDCEITGELYGGDVSTRIQQEIVLGIGGAKLLRALGLNPSEFHMNEGHSAFVSIERIREALEDGRAASFSEAKQIVKASNLFTTHTPVPAGIDVFHRDFFIEYLGSYAEKIGLSKNELFALGQETPSSNAFNMAVFAIRLSNDVNAVSRLHKDVARRLWERILDEETKDDDSHSARKVTSVTNGVHIQSWISDTMASLYDQYLPRGWWDLTSDQEVWSKVLEIPDQVLWEARCSERTMLLEKIASNYHSASKDFQDATLDPKALTIGFARRFATYKRANLILSDRTRLEKLLSDKSRPIQFVFSGKAHPKDFEGKKLIQEIFNFARNSDLARGKIIFLSDYDISVSRSLVQGVDLWLNNPKRPLEACGTSGMKVLSNGGLNLSVLDGWWDEAYSGANGWAIGNGIESHDAAKQNTQDGLSLYDVLEKQVIPEFYDRPGDNHIPRKWVQRMKRSIATLSPRFSTMRMVMEYTQRFYLKEEQLVARKLNGSELGTELLERISTSWEDGPK